MKKVYNVIVLGKGTAGFFAARALSKRGIHKYAVIGRGTGSSYRSPWNMRFENPKVLKKQLLCNAGEVLDEDKKFLLEYLADNHVDFFMNLIRGEWGPIDFFKTTFGFMPKKKRPGKDLLELINRKCSGEFIDDDILEVRREKKLFIVETEKDIFYSKKIIFASGGSLGKGVHTSGTVTRKPNLVLNARRMGAVYEEKGYMRHPFLIKTKGVSNALVSGYFIVNSDFYLEINGKRKRFLSRNIEKSISNDDYHHLFPEIEKEFKEASKRGKIILSSRLSEKDYNDFVRENEYGDVFIDKKYGNWIYNIEITIGNHYMIGGLKINKKMEVVGVGGAYAIGEVASLYGGKRMGGMGHIDSMVLSELLAESIREKN